jgi:hypothetical protein
MERLLKRDTSCALPIPVFPDAPTGPWTSRPATGEQRRYRFANGREVSVIRNDFGSYGGAQGLFECWDGGNDAPNYGPKGWLTIMGVVAYLRDVRDHP